MGFAPCGFDGSLHSSRELVSFPSPRIQSGIVHMAQSGKEAAVSAAVEALRKAMIAADRKR
jgi:hypothetical protein